MTLQIPCHQLPNGEGLDLPRYATRDAAGVDLIAAIPPEAPLLIGVGERRLIPTGLAIAIPTGFEGQVRPRSGLALKHGITVLNAPGTIDADYRGEISVLLINHGEHIFEVTRGMRIAQLIISPVRRIEWSNVGDLTGTDRGGNGYGSTGNSP